MTDSDPQYHGHHACIHPCLPEVLLEVDHTVELHALTRCDGLGTRMPRQMLQGVKSLGVLDVVNQNQWGTETHQHGGLEICFQERGDSVLTHEDAAYTIAPKSLSITRPWLKHSIRNSNQRPGRLHWVVIGVNDHGEGESWQWPDWCILSAADRKELEERVLNNQHPVWFVSEEMVSVFQKLACYAALEDPLSKLSRLAITINQLLITLLETMRSKSIVTTGTLSSVGHTVQQFLSELNRNSEQAALPWTLEGMADHCGMKHSAFIQYTRTLQNTTPIDYLNQCRLRHAADRLTRDTSTSITVIALELGFSSSQYFSRCFKSAYGCSPRAWRQSQSRKA